MLFGVLAIMAGFFFFMKWLYTPDEWPRIEAGSEEAIEVFGNDIEKRLKLEEYSGNFCIQLINCVITSAKAAYEYDYGYAMPGLFSAVLSSITDGLHTDAGNPVTYLNFAYTAFSQYDPSTTAYASKEPGVEWRELPNITNFEDVPEGAIYFTEEDEYSVESGMPQSVPHGEEPNKIDEEQVAAPEKIEIDSKSPQILIYHSHATESYMPNDADNYHTMNEKYSVVSVGSTIAKNLEDKYKYRVVHDKTYHDRPSYAYSYANSLETVKKHTAKHKSIKIILDIHRDAFNDQRMSSAQKAAKKAEYTTTINGKKAARIMLVVGGKNPNYSELEKFAVYIKKKMDKLYPGLFMKITVASNYKYNQYFSNYSALVEVGCMLNTSEEANYSAELFSKVLAEVIKDLKE